MDQSLPGFGIVLTLDLECAFVALRVISPVLESPAPIGTSRNLPAGAGVGLEPLSEKYFVHLLHVRIDAPVFTVDHDAHVIGLRSRQEFSRRLAIQHGMQEAGIDMGVEKIQRRET